MDLRAGVCGEQLARLEEEPYRRQPGQSRGLPEWAGHGPGLRGLQQAAAKWRLVIASRLFRLSKAKY